VRLGYHDGVAKTGYALRIDDPGCSGCGVCVDACNVAALKLADGPVRGRWTLVVDEQVCLGCGACVPVCKRGALRLECVAEPRVPDSRRQLMMQILREKGRLAPFVVSGTKRKLRSLLRGKR